MKKTAFVIYQILVNRENDANKEKESATLRRRKNLDFESSKGKSADFTEQNCFGFFGKIKKKQLTEHVREHASPKSFRKEINF